MRDNNDLNGSKLEGNEIELTGLNPVIKWLDNFWYHHKWKVIIIAFFAVIFAVGIAQMAGKEKEDAKVLVAAPTYFYAEYIDGIDSTLTRLIPTESGAESKNLTLYTYSIYSEEEMKAANEAETDEDGRYVIYVERSYNLSNIEEYRSFLQTGECSILFVSPYLYESLLEQDRLRPLSDVFGNDLPTGATEDGHGVRLGDTYLYQFFDEMKVLPEDTVICLMRSYIWGASSDKVKYAASEEYFKNIVNFGK